MAEPQFRHVMEALCQQWRIADDRADLCGRDWPASSQRDEAGQRAFSDVLGITEEHRKAVIEGLTALRAPCRVELSTDSEDVLTRLNGGRARTNHDGMARLLAAAAPHHLIPHDVRGHAGHPDNKRVDALAQQAAIGVGSGRREKEKLAGKEGCLPSGRHLARRVVCTDPRSELGTRDGGHGGRIPAGCQCLRGWWGVGGRSLLPAATTAS